MGDFQFSKTNDRTRKIDLSRFGVPEPRSVQSERVLPRAQYHPRIACRARGEPYCDSDRAAWGG